MRWLPLVLRVLPLSGVLASPAVSAAPAAELRDAQILAAGGTALANPGGTLRLVEGRLGTPAVPLPEPAGGLPLAAGIASVVWLARRRSARRPCALAALCLAGLALPASAQVPHDATYTGRLLDAAGNPLEGPVVLELWIFDAPVGGPALYGEQHESTPLDVTGRFSVQLGAGTGLTGPQGSFDANLFAGSPNRWLEVSVDGEVLSPRQVVASVPWALVAERAHALVPDPNAPRFEDCGDGTLADRATGLLWEKKTGVPLFSNLCTLVTSCPDPHDVNHAYSWSAAPGGSAPDGSVFTNLLARLNGVWDAPSAQGCLARHCDWRLPTIAEYQEILVGPAAAPGQASGCSSVPCLDPEFVAVAGPVADVATWATDHGAGADDEAWVVVADGTIEPTPKWLLARTRAVRDGSCAD